jgi:hypothetical protein
VAGKRKCCGSHKDFEWRPENVTGNFTAWDEVFVLDVFYLK